MTLDNIGIDNVAFLRPREWNRGVWWRPNPQPWLTKCQEQKQTHCPPAEYQRLYSSGKNLKMFDKTMAGKESNRYTMRATQNWKIEASWRDTRSALYQKIRAIASNIWIWEKTRPKSSLAGLYKRLFLYLKVTQSASLSRGLGFLHLQLPKRWSMCLSFQCPSNHLL